MRKAGPPREIPPPLELECLKVLWIIGEANVKDVREALAETRPLAYTTIMTVLDRLVRKGGVSRRKIGRSFVYSPVLTRESLRRIAVQELVRCFFDGSHEALLEYLQNPQEERVMAVAAGYEEEHDETRLETALL
jgi:BlaI family transcriptional regulator, penicillinase repressor